MPPGYAAGAVLCAGSIGWCQWRAYSRGHDGLCGATVLPAEHIHVDLLKRAEKLRQEERVGRIRAEQRLRELTASVGAGPPIGAGPDRIPAPKATRRSKQLPCFTYQAIGTIQSCFVERNGCPRQGSVVPASRAWLQLRGDINPGGCTDGLGEYSHVQLIFVFHENTNGGKDGGVFKAKIAPPRLQGARKVGTLATRSPHRPNAIGLSTARVERVDAKTGGCDAPVHLRKRPRCCT